jgi:E3 ubiquitin-protein ligase SIAH1
MAEQRKRPSPLQSDEPHGHGDNKKGRARRGMTSNGAVVKREEEEGGEDQQEEGEVREDGDDAGALMATEAVDEPQISLRLGLTLFHCRACHLPLKPPTFKASSVFSSD